MERKRIKRHKNLGVALGFRSGFESRIHTELSKAGIKFTYESEKLDYTVPASEHTYTPDFIIITKSGKKLYIETKGWFKPVDRAKHLLVRKSNPELDIRFIFQNPNSRISKKSKTTYASWCLKKDFKYAREKDQNEWFKWFDE